MEQLKKSNEISGAPGVKHCQVRLFLAADCPSKVGVNSRDHLQAKTSGISDSNCVGSDGRPFGFKGRHYVNPSKEKLRQIPQIKWQCPPKFVLNCNWCVAAGEESEQAEAQNPRETRLLEGVNPHGSTMPPSLSVSLNVEECDHDDSCIPLIPITPIEEDKDVADMQSDMASQLNASFNSQSLVSAQRMLIPENPKAPQCNPSASFKPSTNENPTLEMLLGLLADVVVAAAVALAAMLKSKEQGSLIDTGLLIKFLTDQKMVEKLINENKPAANTETLPVYGPKASTPSVPLPSSKPDVVSKNLVNEHGAIANAGNAPISGLKPSTPSIPLPSSKPDGVIKKLVNEHGATANAGNAPISGPKPSTPSIALPSSKLDETFKKLGNERGVTVNAGNASISGPEPSTPLVLVPSSKPDAASKNLVSEHEATANARNAHISRPKPSTPSVPLPISKPGVVIKKVANESGVTINAGNTLISGLKPSTPSVPLPSSKPDVVIKKLVNEHGATAIARPKPSIPLSSSKPDVVIKKLGNEHGANPKPNAGNAPLSGPKPSAPSLPCSKLDEVVIRKLVNEHGAITNAGNTAISEWKPPASSIPLPISKPNDVMLKKMVNEYGTSDNTGIKPMSGSMPLTRTLPVSSPQFDVMMLPKPNVQPAPSLSVVMPFSPDAVPMPLLSTMTAPPVKDINYYKSLIKQHGEMQQTQDYNLLQFGNCHNLMQEIPKLVKNFNPIELKPKNQKPCIYFNSSKGCRKGSNCLYKHDLMDKSLPAKKLKLDSEISGRT